MIYIITASKDATVYSMNPVKNTGLDQLIEISNIVDKPTTSGVSRGLIKFELNDISKYISDNNITVSSVRFILRETNTSNVPLKFQLNIQPISGSWEMGDGFLYNLANTSGVSWRYRNTNTLQPWLNGQYSNNTTGSFSDGSGGIWYNNYVLSQSYEYKTIDLDIDIKTIFNSWITNTIDNNGLLLKLDTEYEFSSTPIKLNFYSTETNTIHRPFIYVGWNDSVFNTGSLSPIDTTNIKIKISNLKNKYYVNNFYRFNVSGVELFPIKRFSITPILTEKYLPSASYYQIRDVLTNIIIVPFSDYTKISCDASGNFFKLNFNNWIPRKYSIDFKITNGDDTQYYMNNNIFELI